jgi:ATP-binding cassette subfamily B protein
VSPPPWWGGPDDPLTFEIEGDPMRDLFARYARADWPLFVLGVVTSVLGRFVSLAPPLVLGVAIDATFNDEVPYALPLVPAEWLPTTQTEEVVFCVGLVVAALVGSVLLTWTNGTALSLFSNRLQHYIRVDSYEAMQRLDMAFFDDKQTGQVLAVLNDVRESSALTSQPERGAFW